MAWSAAPAPSWHAWRATGRPQRGDKALASLRLIFADLPKLQEPADAYRLCLAEHLLDTGMAPGALMKELGFEPAPFGKDYDPEEPRVPAGNGGRSGEWDFGGRTNTPDQGQGRIVVVVEGDPTDDKKNLDEPAHHHGAGQLPEDERGFQLNPLPGLPLPSGKPIPIDGDPVSGPQLIPPAPTGSGPPQSSVSGSRRVPLETPSGPRPANDEGIFNGYPIRDMHSIGCKIGAYRQASPIKRYGPVFPLPANAILEPQISTIQKTISQSSETRKQAGL